WHDFGSIATPALLAPTMGALFPRVRMRPRFAFGSMLGSAVVGGAWLIAGKLAGGSYPLGLEPIYPGLFMSITIVAMDRLTRARAGR
ncbi:MAG: hypothetical protein ABI960_01125, partial [Candidatus Eisenbacteria bacterium]